MKKQGLSRLDIIRLEAEQRLKAWFAQLSKKRQEGFTRSNKQAFRTASRRNNSKTGILLFATSAVFGMQNRIENFSRSAASHFLSDHQNYKNMAVMAFSSALALSAADRKAVAAILDTPSARIEQQELANKFTRVSQIMNPRFIGAMPEAFEKARMGKDVSGVQAAFDEHKYAFVENGREISFSTCPEGTLKVNFDRIDKGFTEVTSLKKEAPRATGKRAPIYVHT